MEDHSETGHGTADPAQAFDDLRSEVSVLRRTVEALPGAWQENQAPDYSPDLGRMTQGLAVMASHLDAIERHPALKMTPQQHGQAMAQAGEALVLEASRKLTRAAQDMERERQQLANLVGTARQQDEQRHWLLYTGIGVFVLGALVSPFIAGIMPFGLNSQIAALIMYRDRWSAGEALMQAADPKAWQRAVDVMSLAHDNQKALAGCYSETAKTKREQHCVITVSP